MVEVKNPVQIRAVYNGEPGEVCIYRNGNLYHVRKLPNGARNFAFKAMKPGIYTVTPTPAKLTQEKAEFNPITKPLPRPDRNEFKKITIRVNKNLKGTPARIFPKTGIIEVGADFHKLPEQSKLFILLHEVGHLYYSEEKDADFFAIYKFNQMGGNPSQATRTLIDFLTPTEENKKRIESLFNTTKDL